MGKGTYNFGRKGWGIIGFEIIFLFFFTGFTADGLNTIIPQMVALRGWDANTLLAISTPASIIAMLLVVFWGKFIDKWGLKRVTVTTLFLAAISAICYGYSVNIAMYAVSLTLMITFLSAFALTCGFSICANWFPTKKGLIMGIVTIGMNLSSALFNLILNTLSGKFGISMGITILAIVMIIIAVLLIVFLKGKPEDAGCYPDNSPEIAAIIQAEEDTLKEVPLISYKAALKMPRVWILGIAYGFFSLATMGIMSQIITFFQDARGFELNMAMMLVLAAALIGIVGSWLWGIVDQKIGTKKASVAFGVWYFLGILILLIPSSVTMIIGIVMLGCAIGGNGNFLPSMAATIFGRRDFSIPYSIMNMIMGLVRSLAFVVLAVLRGITSGYVVPYAVFACISLIGGIMIAFVNVKKTQVSVKN